MFIAGGGQQTGIIGGDCYRSPSKDDVDEILYKQLGGVAQSPPLVPLGDFNLPDTAENTI